MDVDPTVALELAIAGGRVVTRAKKPMSDFIRGQGSVLLWPIPRRVRDGLEGLIMGVVATTRVRGWEDTDATVAAASATVEVLRGGMSVDGRGDVIFVSRTPWNQDGRCFVAAW